MRLRRQEFASWLLTFWASIASPPSSLQGMDPLKASDRFVWLLAPASVAQKVKGEVAELSEKYEEAEQTQ